MVFEIFEYFPKDFPILETLISAIVAFILGILWYHPKLVGEQALEIRNEELDGYEPSIFVYMIGFLLWLLTSFIFSFMVGFLTPPSIQAMLGLSTFLWVGFTLPPVLLNGLFTGKKLYMIGLDSTYFLAGLYLFAVIHDVMS
jgi:hypothetical protein